MTSTFGLKNRRRFGVAGLAFFVSLVAAGLPSAARAQFLHPKITSRQTTIRNVVVLPAKVNLVRDSMKGPEGMAAESEDLSGRVEKMLADVLANKKNIKTVNAPGPAAEGSTEGKYAVADIQNKFDDLLPKIMKKRKDVKKGRFSMGDEIVNLNLDPNVDAVIFVRGQGQKLTSGKKAFSLLVGGMPAYLMLQIGVIDRHNGEVLLYTDPVLVGDPTTAVDRLRKALESGFKKLPPAS